MEYMANLSTNYITKILFEKELYYFTVRDLAAIMNIPVRKAYTYIPGLVDKGFIKSIEKGKYLLLGFEPERVLSNPFFIASHIVYPSYVSYWSALNFYGFTEQVPAMVFLASTRKKAKVEFNGFRFKYVLVNPKKFFGYRKERIGDLDFLIAEGEKAIIDSLDLPGNAGGVSEVAKAVYNAKNSIELDSRSLCSRLGYLLERFGTDADVLLNNASREYVKLDPARPKSRVWDKKWRVNVNLGDAELLGWRET